jgi:hypothetical protein
MDKNLIKLALECARGNWDYDREGKIPNVRIVKKVETETDVLYFWNSSCDFGFNEKRALFNISEELEEGKLAGSVSVDFHEIMFEVIEK